MPERRTLKETWLDFLLQCVPEQASVTQQVETKRAYYAGAAALFGILTGDLDADHEPTPADVVFVEGIYQELKQFAKDLNEGRA